MSNNVLRDFSIFGNIGVKTLLINNNKLKSLPNNFSDMCPALTSLFLAKNVFESFPAEILECKNVVKLDLSQNKLVSLPSDQVKNLDFDQVLFNSYLH